MTFSRKLLAVITLIMPTTALASTPFFDNDPSTPFTPAYAIGEKPIDRDILKACGEWGARVKKDDVEAIISAHHPVIDKIKKLAGAKANGLTIKRIVEIWTTQDAFAHVFCGEPSNDRLGGLHYAPRYKQGSQKGWISMCGKNAQSESCIDNNKNEYVETEGTYSIPVYYKKPTGGWNKKGVSGYNVYMNADEMLIEGTAAFLLFVDSIPSGNKDGCIRAIKSDSDKEYESHNAVAAMTKSGLVTFYSVGPKGKAYSIKKYRTKPTCTGH